MQLKIILTSTLFLVYYIVFAAIMVSLYRRCRSTSISKTTSQFRRKNMFITYGCERFAVSKSRILYEAENTEYFETVRAYVPTDVFDILEAKGAHETLEVMRMPRGGGYWIWKPIVIHAALSELNEGDVLVYADAGCVVHNEPQRIQEDLQAIRDDPIGISHCGTRGGFRKNRNRMDVTKAMLKDADADVIKDFLEHHTDGEEFEANRLVICKKPNSVSFVNQWMDVALRNPRWFTDDPSDMENHPDFIEHRHDQSIYNLLAYIHGVLGNTCHIDDWITASRLRT